MSIADELHKLGELHRRGALTDVEFAQAKARVLAGEDAPPAADEEGLRDQISDLRRENELARLDREWQQERERYYITTRYGNRQMASKTGAVLMGVITVGFGVFWTAMAAGMTGLEGPAACFPLFGVLFILVGLGMSIYTFTRASQFAEAQRRYQQRRAIIVADDREQPLSPGTPRPASSTSIQDLAEPAPCLGCGKTIPAGQERCPHCGWSYT